MPARNNPQPAAEPVYPNIERFIESNGRDSVAGLFADTRARLNEIASGPRAPAAKRALLGIERAEALLGHLFDVREKLETQARAKKGRR